MPVDESVKTLMEMGFRPHPTQKGMLISPEFMEEIQAAAVEASADVVRDILSGGPGSGCHGPNCGRPPSAAVTEWAESRSPRMAAIVRLLSSNTDRTWTISELVSRSRLTSGERVRERLDTITRMGRRTGNWSLQSELRPGTNELAWRLQYPRQATTTPTSDVENVRRAVEQVRQEIRQPEPIREQPRQENTNPDFRKPTGSLTNTARTETVASLRAKNINISEEDLDKFYDSFKMSPLDLKNTLYKGLPNEIMSGFTMSINQDSNVFQMSTRTDVFKQDRTFNFRGMAMGHDYQALPDRYQGHGWGKVIFSNQLDLYDHLGMKKVDVHAGLSGGGYAWARFGFVPDQVSWDHLRNNARSRLDNITAADTKAQARFILSIQDPKAIWVLASLKDRNNESVGKQLLRGQKWSGSLNLNDRERYQVSRAYSGSRR